MYEGVTKKYHYITNEKKTFSRDTVRSTDIIYADNYIRKNNVNDLRQLYIGTTDSKYYQDETGNAYVVIFDNEGYVRSLYKGIFLNGKRNDDTMKAFAIEYSEQYDKYFLNEDTIFKDGKAQNKSNESISKAKIEELNIDLGKYTDLLHWKQVNDVL